MNARILDALKSEGINDDALTLDDLARFDQIHFGGRDVTHVLANLAGLKLGMEVLDIGTGIEDPARTLAAEFGGQVIGLDITEESVKAAQMLTDEVVISEAVSFREGNALDLEFGGGAFDKFSSPQSKTGPFGQWATFRPPLHWPVRANSCPAATTDPIPSRQDKRFARHPKWPFSSPQVQD